MFIAAYTNAVRFRSTIYTFNISFVRVYAFYVCIDLRVWRQNKLQNVPMLCMTINYVDVYYQFSFVFILFHFTSIASIYDAVALIILQITFIFPTKSKQVYRCISHWCSLTASLHIKFVHFFHFFLWSALISQIKKMCNKFIIKLLCCFR